MKFIKLKDEKYNQVYIRIDTIKAIYSDYEEKATAVDYDKDSVMYVQESVEYIAERLKKIEGGE